MQQQMQDVRCVGFIMDGNRRWAKERGLPTLSGHKKGADVLEETIRWVRDGGIPHAVFYAFSSENWKRGEDEVAYLLDLLADGVRKIHKRLQDDTEKKVRFRFIGDISKFGTELQAAIREVEEESVDFTDTTVWIAVSYGGRAEIVDAVNRAVENETKVDEETFASLLATAEMPDPDIIVRTGGQQRLSNFVTWRSVYSELLFIKKYWPDITNDDLDAIVVEYQARQRNFGK